MVAAVDDTLIVCDWDDTLLPTTWLQRGALEAGHDAVRPADLTSKQKAQLEALEGRVLSMLTAFQRVGTVVVITNATDSYVELTAAAFMPAVAAWLKAHDVCVLSARSWYEAAFPDAPSEWKLRAFNSFVNAWQESHGGRPPVHVISIGDSLYERWAAHSIAATWGHAVAAVKTVKLKEHPSCRDLADQARFLARQADAMVTWHGDMDFSVVLPRRAARATSQSSLSPSSSTSIRPATPPNAMPFGLAIAV